MYALIFVLCLALCAFGEVYASRFTPTNQPTDETL